MSLTTSRFVPLMGVAVVLLSACADPAKNHAPVEDRSTGKLAVPLRPPKGGENSGKSGFYTVKPGDTLIRVGLEHGQSWKDLARWNQMGNPNELVVGDVLRVTSPEPPAVTSPVTTTKVEAKPLEAKPEPMAKPDPMAKPAPEPEAAKADNNDPEAVAFAWPAKGRVLARFDEGKNKGLDLAGNAGDPVLASAEGRVVYAGSGLRGYGNLIIIKHNNTFLTAYAHNQTLLVKEDETVRKGQKIAEMGKTDSDVVKLHFEVRRLGKPVDPSKYLPAQK